MFRVLGVAWPAVDSGFAISDKLHLWSIELGMRLARPGICSLEVRNPDPSDKYLSVKALSRKILQF